MKTLDAGKIINDVGIRMAPLRDWLFYTYNKKAFDVREKDNGTLVTSADIYVEESLRRALKDIIPEAGFMGEETGKGIDSPFMWIIDPLDGTTNFIRGIPVFAMSVGLYRNGEPWLGIVCNVMEDIWYWGWLGGGAWKNGVQLFASKETNIKNAIIATGFPLSDFSHYDVWTRIFKELGANIRGVRRSGSAALDMVMTASGKYDAFIEYGLKVWDVAGALPICLEAGCIVCDFYGGNGWLDGSSIIVAGKGIAGKIKEIVAKIAGNPEKY